jgi:predicted site-specific integrase-resolvase
MNLEVQPDGLVPKLGLNRVEAAKAIGVSAATLDRLAQRGLIRPCRATYRPIYWVKELERFLHENSQPSEWRL